MKKIILVTISFIAFGIAQAQDVITLKTGEDIQALVQDVGEESVKYKKFSNQQGPTYSVRATARNLFYQ